MSGISVSHGPHQLAQTFTTIAGALELGDVDGAPVEPGPAQVGQRPVDGDRLRGSMRHTRACRGDQGRDHEEEEEPASHADMLARRVGGLPVGRRLLARHRRRPPAAGPPTSTVPDMFGWTSQWK